MIPLIVIQALILDAVSSVLSILIRQTITLLRVVVPKETLIPLERVVGGI